MIRFMKIAVKPSIIINSLPNGTSIARSLIALTGFVTSSQLKKTNNKNVMLQINVNLDKNKITLIPFN